jgi:poly-gamma-glutamate synthesis protein (capsule biosynthesis protein)
VVGAGASAEQAYAAHVVKTTNGRRVALLAIDDTDEAATTIATAKDRARLAEGISTAGATADTLIVLVHWGEENTPRVTERQRELARWLIDRGVDLVAGSHPHCIQPLDFYHGKPIIYSLGNLVFDGAPTLPSWNKGQLLEVSFAQNGLSSLRLIAVKLDRRGFPHADAGAETAQR